MIRPLLGSALLLIAACTSPPAATEPLVAPNPDLVVQGIPPIPARLAEAVAQYTDLRGHGLVRKENAD